MVITFFSRGKCDFSMPLNLTAAARSGRQSRSVATQSVRRDTCRTPPPCLSLRPALGFAWGGGRDRGKGMVCFFFFPRSSRVGSGCVGGAVFQRPVCAAGFGADSWLLNNG